MYTSASVSTTASIQADTCIHNLYTMCIHTCVHNVYTHAHTRPRVSVGLFVLCACRHYTFLYLDK